MTPGAPGQPDTPFSLGSQGGDMMHLLLRSLLRGRDSTMAQDPSVAGPSARVGMSGPGGPPPSLAGKIAQPPQHPAVDAVEKRGFGSVKRRSKKHASRF